MTAADDSRALAPLYALLARISLLELDRELLGLLREPGLIEVLDKVEPGCRADVMREWSDRDLEAAAEEYCALFLLPDGAVPRASAWIPGEQEMVGSGVDELVDRVLEALGVTPDGVLARVPRDHLGFLLHLAAVALDDDDAAARSVARGLIDQALAPWVGRWTDAVLARAEQPVYRAHARLLAALLSPD
ncbi:MAG: hypothetical protein E4H03_05325 [Myxococcales bacterium]|nr:MAG: hypothetical protein E4H03_05325 [Myxococcales bacterium]